MSYHDKSNGKGFWNQGAWLPAGMERSPVSETHPGAAVGGNRLLRQHDPLQQKT